MKKKIGQKRKGVDGYNAKGQNLMPHVPNKRQIIAFAKCCKDTDTLILYLLGIALGLRIGSAVRLKWEDCDLLKGRFFIMNDKNVLRFRTGYGKDRLIDILPEYKQHFLPILQMWKRMNPDEELVLPRGKSTATEKTMIRRYESRFEEIYEKLNMRIPWTEMKNGHVRYRYNNHSPRHICGTNMAHLGYDILDICKYLGHANPEESMTYLHLAGVRGKKAIQNKVEITLKPDAEQLMKLLQIMGGQVNLQEALQNVIVQQQSL